METTSVFAPIFKSQEQDDGTLMVYGKATGSDLDLDNQRCDPEWLSRAMPEWFKIGNIREQHNSQRAVGKAMEHEVKADGHYIRAHIVDPLAVQKTKAGIFTGFSIGISKPRLEKSNEQEWIRDGLISEVSICDRPALPTARFTMCKAAKPGMSNIAPGDFDSERMLVKVEELDETPEMMVTIGENLTQEQVDRFRALTGEDVQEKTLEITGDPAKAVAALNETKAAIDKLGPGKPLMMTPTGPAILKTDWAEASNEASANGGNGCGCCNQCICNPGPRGEAVGPDFDRDAAKALVATLVKDGPSENLGVTVPPIAPPEELDDIMGAKAAIALIAQLIQSEASEMVCAPNEDYDIQLLLEAVSALRCFIMREKGEPGGDMMMLTADGELDKKAKYNAEQLRDMLAAGKAMKNKNGDPSYPIADKEDLKNAIHAVGRGSGDHDAIRSYIKKRASALGASDMIPEDWNKTVGDTLTKAADDEQTEGAPADKAAGSGEDPNSEAGEGAQGVDARTEAESTKASESGQEGQQDAEAVQDSGARDSELTKAAGPDLHKAIEDTLNKVFSGEEDNIIRKTMMAIVEAATKSAAESVTQLTERLEKVEQMAAPGGPALRRTDIERTQARKSELEHEVFKFKELAKSADDPILRKGYHQKASALEAEIRTI